MVRRSTLIAGVAAISFASGAWAQLTGSVSLLSDYRFRGVSFSSDLPAAQGEVSYDFASGWYTGAFLSSVKFDAYPKVHRMLLTYAGYAHRISPDLSVDAGVGYADFSSGSDFDYVEVHTGLTARFLNVQLSYAPSYFGQQRAGTYFELNGGTGLTDSLRLFGHAGLLYVRPEPYRRTTSTQVDGRVGLRYDYEFLSLQLSWVGVNRISLAYPVDASQAHGAWVVQVSALF
ncbi:MAG TPA: TorF family putative porin [Burkholderiaceae bacterium]|nr:TorF family putative porin [Burkholderiaceae bacterium]